MKKQLKEWERGFKAAHGRPPTQSDIQADPVGMWEPPARSLCGNPPPRYEKARCSRSTTCKTLSLSLSTQPPNTSSIASSRPGWPAAVASDSPPTATVTTTATAAAPNDPKPLRHHSKQRCSHRRVQCHPGGQQSPPSPPSTRPTSPRPSGPSPATPRPRHRAAMAPSLLPTPAPPRSPRLPAPSRRSAARRWRGSGTSGRPRRRRRRPRYTAGLSISAVCRGHPRRRPRPPVPERPPAAGDQTAAATASVPPSRSR